MQIQFLGGLTADKLLDALAGGVGFFKDGTSTDLDDGAYFALDALRRDAAFMSWLRGKLDGAKIHSEPQAIDLNAILQIIAAIKQIIDLFSKLRGGLPQLPGVPGGYRPNEAVRCV